MVSDAFLKVDKIMIVMLGVRTWHADAHLARLAVKANLLSGMLLAHDILLELQLVDAMVYGDLHLLMRGHTRATH